MFEPHEESLAKAIDLTDASKLNVELEHPFKRLRAFGIARVSRDLAASFDRQRRARQIFAAGRHYAQHFSFERKLRAIH
jgi:hypothetical protein